ncbi:putative teichuronic acid biosynthesis glycosyltransferase TuaG [compost metagenome]
MNSGDQNIEQIKLRIKTDIYSLIERGFYSEALNTLSEYNKAVIDDPDSFVLEGIIYYSMKEQEKALAAIQNGLRRYPFHKELRFNLAFLFEERGYIEQAAYFYYLALLTDTDNEWSNNVNERIKNISQKIGENYSDLVTSWQQQFPKISVIIPAYNQKVYLKQTIDSLLEQSYPNVEVIVADDCSTDGTDQMMSEYSENSKIVYKRNEVNLGPGNNGSHAFYHYADGKYVLIINHDDYLIDPHYFFKAILLMEENPDLSMVSANVKRLEVQTGYLTNVENIIMEPTINGENYFLKYETRDYPHLYILSTIFKRENATRMDCHTEKTKCRDLFIILKLMLTGDVGFINDYVGVYRVHPGSISFSLPPEFDYPTINELEKLRDVAYEKLSSKEKLNGWLEDRVYRYLRWRLQMLVSQDDYTGIQNIIVLSSKYYPEICNLLLQNIVHGRL